MKCLYNEVQVESRGDSVKTDLDPDTGPQALHCSEACGKQIEINTMERLLADIRGEVDDGRKTREI